MSYFGVFEPGRPMYERAADNSRILLGKVTQGKFLRFYQCFFQRYSCASPCMTLSETKMVEGCRYRQYSLNKFKVLFLILKKSCWVYSRNLRLEKSLKELEIFSSQPHA